MAWALRRGRRRAEGLGLPASGVVMVAYVSAGGLLASAWVNLLELVVLLAGFALALPFAWQAAGGWAASPPRRPAGRRYGGLVGMGGPGDRSACWSRSCRRSSSRPASCRRRTARAAPRPRATRDVANAAALALFALRARAAGHGRARDAPALANPELALPALMADVLPPWVGALALAALFAAEISTADAVLFMVSTSLAQDLYQHVPCDPAPTTRACCA